MPFQAFFDVVGYFFKTLWPISIDGVKINLAHHCHDDTECSTVSYVRLLIKERGFAFCFNISNITRIHLMMMTAMVVRNSNRSTLPQPSWPISVRGEGNGG